MRRSIGFSGLSVAGLFALCVMRFVQSGVFLGPQENRSAAAPKLALELVAKLDLGEDPKVYDVVGEIQSGKLFVLDMAGRKVAKVDLKRPMPPHWIALEGASCSSPERLEAGALVKKASYLFVLYCGKVAVLDGHNLAHVTDLTGDPGHGAYDFAVSPDERLVAVAFIRDFTTERSIRIFRISDWKLHAKFDAKITTLQFTPDGRYLTTVFARNPDPRARKASECGMTYFNITSGEKVHEWSRSVKDPPCPEDTFSFLPGRPNEMFCDDFSGGGISLWDSETGVLLRSLRVGSNRRPFWLSASSDGRLVAGDFVWPESSRGPRYDLVVWELKHGEVIHRIESSYGDDRIVRARFSSEGNFVLLIFPKRIELHRYTLAN